MAYSGHQSTKYLTLGLIINTAFPSRIINLLSEFKTSWMKMETAVAHQVWKEKMWLTFHEFFREISQGAVWLHLVGSPCPGGGLAAGGFCSRGARCQACLCAGGIPLLWLHCRAVAATVPAESVGRVLDKLPEVRPILRGRDGFGQRAVFDWV